MGTTYLSKSRRSEIKDIVAEQLNKLWVLRNDLRLGVTDPESLVKIAAVPIAQSIYGYTVTPLQEIPSDDSEYEVAGVIDRHARQIIVAKKYGLESQRFTLAHEIGHLILHPGRIYHRDRPLNGGESNAGLPYVEREANAFAAELLMPERLIVEVFVRCFGGRLDATDINEDFTYKISVATGKPLTVKQLREMGPFRRALLIADADSLGGAMFQSLRERFRVSKSAMAVRLLELDLVT